MNVQERSYIRMKQAMPVARRYLFRGKRMTRAEVATLTGWPLTTIATRINVDQIEDRPPVTLSERRRASAKRYWFRGEKLTARQISELTGHHPGWAYDHVCGDAILEDRMPRNIPVNSKAIFFRGECLPPFAWARRLGLNPQTLYHRLAAGWSAERALTTPTLPNRGSIVSRNVRILRRIAATARRERNAGITARMWEAIHDTRSHLPPRGYAEISPIGDGTGVGSHEIHCEGTSA